MIDKRALVSDGLTEYSGWTNWVTDEIEMRINFIHWFLVSLSAIQYSVSQLLDMNVERYIL